MSIPDEIVIYKGNACEKRTDFIWGRQIDDEVCDNLLEFWDNQRFLPVVPGQVYREGDPTVDIDFKESMDMMVPHQIAMSHVQNYLQALQGVLDDYVKTFPFCNTSRFQIVEPLSFQCYPVGGGFKEWHTERLNALPGTAFRHLVFMTYLNDVPDGGTILTNNDMTITAVKGKTVFFPTGITHVHAGQISKKHEKYICTGWIKSV